jgi:hypothetical protein
MEKLLRLLIVGVASVSAIIGTIFSLTHGISSAFQFLYILPIICAVYFYPRRAVIFALAISIIYISLVYLLGAFDPVLIAISTAWFAIFIVLAVVSSSYANGLIEEKLRIQNILDHNRDGIFCFDPLSWRIRGINQKCAHWLLYSQNDLNNAPVSTVWADEAAQKQFMDKINGKETDVKFECNFRQKSGVMLRCIISPLYVTKNMILCSFVKGTAVKIADEEIRQTLEDLERQVRERTAHLEKINEELRAEVIERRTFEKNLLSGDDRDEFGNMKEK